MFTDIRYISLINNKNSIIPKGDGFDTKTNCIVVDIYDGIINNKSASSFRMGLLKTICEKRKIRGRKSKKQVRKRRKSP